MISSKQEVWMEEDSDIFIRYGKYFVPYQDKQIEIICDLIPNASSLTSNQVIVDLCCGQGLLTEALLERFPDAQIIALDGSPKMLQEVKTRLAHFGERLQIKLFDLHSLEWREFLTPVSTFVSSLAIHHMDGLQKKALFSDLYKILIPGGALLIADLILPLTEKSLLVAAKSWDEIVKTRSIECKKDLSAFDVFRKLDWNYFYNLNDPIDKPSPIFIQLKWLEEVGFKNVETYWVVAGHAIYGGYK